ncbi:tetratricopeptide repeat protein [Octadecabacter sp. 1_MG-2023]|uniref:tetratricopeptide repeat protein n=1 Tax=unclassified Octadecabacter TaxID=196158 RepID=UPI002090C693|nr:MULTISPECIES: tetratricopeptide repeat protein [unclassified Octadecabacter]MDO6736070.1 tetratricopeptide repeat protein [Octadecabacter sp. 1_MG-2023]
MLKLLLVFGFVLGLAACDSSEERAEAYYQSGLELLEDGDTDRAMVEFRNVLQLNAEHRDARVAIAKIARDNGNVRVAYNQYLRVAEQNADDVEARIALTEIAIGNGDWEEARRHGTRAVELAPEEDAVKVLALNLDYAQAVEDENNPARRAAAQAARLRLEGDPENNFLRQILIDNAMRDGELQTALEEVAAAQAIEPGNRRLYDIQLGILGQLERQDDIEILLRDMLVKFPEDEDLPSVLLRFYVATNDPENAEAFLREIADSAETPEARTVALMTTVRLLIEVQGNDAGLAELDHLIATEEETTTYQALRASMLFDAGQRDEGIAEIEALIDAQDASEDLGALQVGLAQMLIITGDSVGARALVEEILENDPTQVNALKIKAGWLIESDEIDEAVSMLRSVLAQDGDDAQALTLMARAHNRNGDQNLTREFLALAVDASNAAPTETLRYTAQLIEEERYLPAEEALLSSLRLAPNNLEVLQTLGRLYITTEDWGRAQQVEDTLNRLEDPIASRLAVGLQAARLAARDQMGNAVTLLESYAAEAGENETAARIAVIQARLLNGDQELALASAQEMVDAAPQDLTRQFTLAAVQSALGQYEDAIATYRLIVDKEPRAQQAWVRMVQAMYATGDVEAAQAAVQEGLSVLPEGLDLLWAQAGFNEQRGDIDAAIELYELIYERAPNQLVAANNLASLLSTYRLDDESLERAFTISRRLRNTDVPPFQDTYGWIAYRRGDLDEALEYLEPAAAGLPSDPLVQFHLGMTYVGLARDTDALVALQRALDIAGPDDTREQFATARAEIARIEAAPQEETDVEPQQ